MGRHCRGGRAMADFMLSAGAFVLLMVAVGYSEEARGAAQPVILPRGGPGQNDVTSPAFLAWHRERAAGVALDATLATLAAAANHSDSTALAAALRGGGAIGRELEALAGRFRDRVYDSAG